MEATPQGTPNGFPPATTTADTSQQTMGGLYMFDGAARFGADTIIPLSATDFVIVSSDNMNIFDQRFLAKTIVATNPLASTPMGAADQDKIIQSEMTAYATFHI
jgi:hypothetical protein